MENVVLPLMHDLVALLLYPVAVGLIVLVGMAVFEIGTALGERYGALKHVTVLEKNQVEAQGRKRIERADMIARIAPMFGLMGTLIPLGPGLAALGQGNLTILTEAITIAFDTTVLGLLAGAIGFVLGRFRRRWYDTAMDRLEALEARGLEGNGR